MQRILIIDAGQFGKLRIDFSDEPLSQQMTADHFHDGWEVFCWLGSRMTYYLDGKTLPVPHSAVVPVPPGMRHRTNYDTDALRWKLDIGFEDQFFGIFPSDDVRNRVRETLLGGMQAVSVKWANELRQTVVGTLLSAEEDDPLCAAQVAFAVASILTGIAQTADSTPKENGAVGMRHTHVAAATAIIDREYASDVSLEALAQRLHLTTAYICHIFHDVLGMTVSEYVRARRIRAARTLLLQTSLSVAEIAEQVGFCTVNYFTKCFRIEEGISPSRYRAVVLGKQKASSK